MSDDKDTPQRPNDAVPTDAEGNEVNVAERVMREDRGPVRTAGEVVPPVGTKVMEQNTEALNEKTAEVERKLNR
ncbi:hypothetical protein ACLUUI_19890 [Enterobacterales bacterium AW_CKDN230030176-1A_HGKHYDSX7]